MCTKGIAFVKALAHTCEQISRVLCGEIKNFQTKQKQKSNHKKAGTLARPAFLVFAGTFCDDGFLLEPGNMIEPSGSLFLRNATIVHPAEKSISKDSLSSIKNV